MFCASCGLLLKGSFPRSTVLRNLPKCHCAAKWLDVQLSSNRQVRDRVYGQVSLARRLVHTGCVWQSRLIFRKMRSAPVCPGAYSRGNLRRARPVQMFTEELEG